MGGIRTLSGTMPSAACKGAELPWAPWSGKHSSELLDADGRVLGRAFIQVRGAQVKRVF